MTRNSALIVIDIQEAFTGSCAYRPYPYANTENLLDNINYEIHRFMSEDNPIIYVRQEFAGFWWKLYSRVIFRGAAIIGTESAKLDKRLTVATNYEFTKCRHNAFTNPQLVQFLKNNTEIKHLYIVGLDAAHCVYKTAIGAKSEGYNVDVIHKCLTTFGKKQKEPTKTEWDKLMDRYKRHNIVIH